MAASRPVNSHRGQEIVVQAPAEPPELTPRAAQILLQILIELSEAKARETEEREGAAELESRPRAGPED